MGEDWVSRHLVHLFKSLIDQQMNISNHSVYLGYDQSQKPFSA